MIPFFVDKYLILYNLISPLKKEAAYYLKMERLATNVVEDIVFIYSVDLKEINVSQFPMKIFRSIVNCKGDRIGPMHLMVLISEQTTCHILKAEAIVQEV